MEPTDATSHPTTSTTTEATSASSTIPVYSVPSRLSLWYMTIATNVSWISLKISTSLLYFANDHRKETMRLLIEPFVAGVCSFLGSFTIRKLVSRSLYSKHSSSTTVSSTPVSVIP